MMDRGNFYARLSETPWVERSDVDLSLRACKLIRLWMQGPGNKHLLQRMGVTMPLQGVFGKAFAITVLTAASLLLSWPVNAKNPLIAEARESYEILDLEGARDTLAEALANPDNTDEDLKEIYELMGITFSLLDEEEKAQEAFTNLLALDRNAELDSSVPEQVRDFFEKVKRNLPANLERPRPAVSEAKSKPAQEETEGAGAGGGSVEQGAEDELAGILGEPKAEEKQEKQEGNEPLDQAQSAERFPGTTAGPEKQETSGESDDLDLAALEAEAAAELGETEEDEGGQSGVVASGGTEILEARQEGGSGDVVKVLPPTVREVSQGAPVEMEVDVDDLSNLIQKIILYYRPEGSNAGFSSTEGQKLTTGKYFFKIPMIWDLSAGDVLALEYYIEALGAGDQVIGTYGQASVPHLLRRTLSGPEEGRTVVRSGGKPFYETAWFWGIVGGVVAAGTATGLAVAFWPEAQKASPGALGKITLQPK